MQIFIKFSHGEIYTELVDNKLWECKTVKNCQ